MIQFLWIYPTALLLGFMLDLLLGDPRWLPHPVRWIGKLTKSLEGFLHSAFQKPLTEICAGIVLVFLVVGGVAAGSALVLVLSREFGTLAKLLVAVYLIYTSIAVKDMERHIGAVYRALEENNLALARERVALLVSRDCSAMDGKEISATSLESLLENTADGVVAPLFYAALGGPVLAMVFKSINTMDSMVGYKNSRYRYFGWAAAKLDDLMCWVPARLCALIFLVVGQLQGNRWYSCWSILMRDRYKHDSPNSAWPEAAGAAVMGVRLGGPAIYGGVLVHRPYINPNGRSPVPADLQRGRALFNRAAVVSLLVTLVLAISVAAVKYVLQQ